MIISASKIQGYNYTATPTLSTIGNLIFLYDYRRSADTAIIPNDSTLRLYSLGDLSQNNIQLNSSGVSGQTTRPKYFINEGFGSDNLDSASLKGIHLPVLNKLHNGTPFLLFAVFENNVAAGEYDIISTYALTDVVPGFRCRARPNNNQILTTWRDDSGSGNIGSFAVPMPPLNEVTLVQIKYYGAGTGANNLQIKVKSTDNFFTLNPTFGGNNSKEISVGTALSNAQFKYKMTSAWDLEGKTPNEIDDFQELAINTLKQDIEYSSLITA